jgi:hypothetical protein
LPAASRLDTKDLETEFDQAQAQAQAAQQQGDGRQCGQFGEQGIFQGRLHGECEGSVAAACERPP